MENTGERKGTLVVIDDDTTFLRLACRHLTDAGFEVLEFTDSLDALEHVLASPPDLILADIRMPGLDGFGMLGALRSQAGTMAVPLIFMTAIRDTQAQRKGMRLGADDFLVKPIARADLLDAVNARLERAQVLRVAARNDQTMVSTHRSGIEPYPAPDTVTMLVALADIAKSGDYRILRKLGEGGMSRIYLAEDRVAARQVVLKVMRFDEDVRDDFVQRFTREHAMLNRVSASSVAQVYAHGINESCAYLVMEYFAGGSLRTRMARPLGLACTFGIMREIAGAVAGMHRLGIVHRDLKPENIMLRADGSPAVTDFGNAADLNTGVGPGQDEVVTGTPAYMSPEHARGAAVHRESDVYSMGVMFYELLTGKRPFNAVNVKALMHQHATAPAPRLPDDVSLFQGLIDAMLAKSAADRPADAGAVAQRLEQLRPRLRALIPVAGQTEPAAPH